MKLYLRDVSIAILIVVLGYFFLSSGRPAFGMSGAQHLEIHMASVFEIGDDPILYTEWDIPVLFDAWYKMQEQLVAVELYDKMEAALKAAADQEAAELAAKGLQAERDAVFWKSVEDTIKKSLILLMALIGLFVAFRFWKKKPI